MPPKTTGDKSRARLIAAMTDVARAKGYHATRVEDVCAAAGVTKGSFFHHFASRDAVGLAAAKGWRSDTAAFFDHAEFNAAPTAVARVLAYVAFRRALLMGDVASYCCYAGTVVTETFQSQGATFAEAKGAIDDHIAFVQGLVAAALTEIGRPSDTRALALSTFIQGTVQGALILAKSAGGAAPAQACLDELTRHLTQELKATP